MKHFIVLVEKLKITDHSKEQKKKNQWIFAYIYICLVEIIQNVVVYINFYVRIYPELFSHHYNFVKE